MPVTIGIGAGVGLLSQGIGMYNSYQERKAAEESARKQGPYENFSVTPQMQNVYSTATNDVRNALGFTGAERTNFTNQLAQNTATNLYNANRATGGNMARYLSRGMNTRNIQAMNDFASQDARLRIQNRNSALGRQASAAGAMQGVADRNVQAKNYRKQLIEQALGGAIAQQKQNFQNSISTIGNVGFTAAGYGLNSYLNNGRPQQNYDPVTGEEMLGFAGVSPRGVRYYGDGTGSNISRK